MDKRRVAWLSLGSLGLGLGALAVAEHVGAFDRRKALKKAPRDYTELPPPPEEDDEVPLEPWEEEAAAVPPTNGGMIDRHVEPHETAVGRGHPDDHRIELPSLEQNPAYDVTLRDRGPRDVTVRIRPALPETSGKRSWLVRQVPRVANAAAKPWKVKDPLHDPEFAPESRGVPFAPIGVDSTWPVQTKSYSRLVTSYRTSGGWHGYSGRSFKSKRHTDEGEVRQHAGVDLFAQDGDVVLAPEEADVLAILPFHHGSWAIYLITDDGRVINLGEVEKYSWRKYKIRPGDRVQMGQPLARIALMSGGGHMLHYEMYDSSVFPDRETLKQAIRDGHFRWLDADNPPAGLYDPTEYLLTAASRTYRREHGVDLHDPSEEA